MKLLAPDNLSIDQRRKLESVPGLQVSWLSIKYRRARVRKGLNLGARRVLSLRAYSFLRFLLEPPAFDLEIEQTPLSERSDWEFDALLANWTLDQSAINVLLPRLPSLRWIHSTVTGADHFDGGELHRRGILLTLPKAVQAKRVAEFVLALIFADIKNIPEHTEASRKGRSRFLPSIECRDVTIGIVGFGNIGREVAGMAVKNGMRTLAYTRADSRSETSPPTTVTHDLNQVFSQADIVILALPSTSTTRGLIGREHFRLMKKNASVINVGRGDTLRDEDLLSALNAKQIRRAYLDVLHDELTGRPYFNPPRHHPLLQHPRVVFTGYSSSDSVHSSPELFSDFFVTLEKRMSNTPVHNAADLLTGY